MARRWFKRREYQPGAPLVANQRIQFRGVVYAKGQTLPPDQLTARKHRQLWQVGKADHPAEEPEAPPMEAKMADPEAMTWDELEAATAVTPPPLETANMRLPAERVATLAIDPPRAPAPAKRRPPR